MKKIQILFKFLMFACAVNTVYSCKKEPKENAVIRNDTHIAATDSSTVKGLTAEQKTQIVYHEIKNVKKVSNYPEGPMQSFDFSFNDYVFKIRYIDERSYIQYKIADRIIRDWQFCNVNFYYDSSWETVEQDSHVLYNDSDSSGVLLFPGFTEEYATYFVYEFNNHQLRYIKSITLNRDLSAELWENPHEFRAVRKNSQLQISLLDKDGRKYIFEGTEEAPGNEPGNSNLSKDLIMLNNQKNDEVK